MTITSIMPDIYRIEIPLPDNPLRAINSYLILGDNRNLLVDTGFNREECKNSMCCALKELNIDMETTDIFVTHMHSDHAGLVSFLCTPKTIIYMSKEDGKIVSEGQTGEYWASIRKFFQISGLFDSGLEKDPNFHPGYRYASPKIDSMTFIPDGHNIVVGDYNFLCIKTSGHTEGHMCLYEPQKRLLLSGDHILGKITPNITQWKTEGNLLEEFLKSLDKIDLLDIDLVLPGHRNTILDVHKRIAELKLHHKNRLENVLNILGPHTMNAEEVASKMQWNMSYKTWNEYPWAQRIFATGEAFSHLCHMVYNNKVEMFLNNDVVYFKSC